MKNNINLTKLLKRLETISFITLINKGRQAFVHLQVDPKPPTGGVCLFLYFKPLFTISSIISNYIPSTMGYFFPLIIYKNKKININKYINKIKKITLQKIKKKNDTLYRGGVYPNP